MSCILGPRARYCLLRTFILSTVEHWKAIALTYVIRSSPDLVRRTCCTCVSPSRTRLHNSCAFYHQMANMIHSILLCLFRSKMRRYLQVPHVFPCELKTCTSSGPSSNAQPVASLYGGRACAASPNRITRPRCQYTRRMTESRTDEQAHICCRSSTQGMLTSLNRLTNSF